MERRKFRGMGGAAERHPQGRSVWFPASNALSQAQLWTAHRVVLCSPVAGGDRGAGVKRTLIVLGTFCFHWFERLFRSDINQWNQVWDNQQPKRHLLVAGWPEGCRVKLL